MKCAVLGPGNVYLGMEEVGTPTDRHLPAITECDLPPGEYRWVADESNPYGGAFVALPGPVRASARALRAE